MTNVRALLEEWRNRDVHVWADGERLKCSAPAGAMTPELRDQLRRHRDDILEFLGSAAELARQQRAIVPLQPRGNRIPIFAVGGHNGDVFCYRALAKHAGVNQPFYGLQPPGLDGTEEPFTRVEDLAAYFSAQIRAFHPAGPCIIAGYCAGGSIAFELARQLRQLGMPVPFLVMFGTPFPTLYRRWPQFRLRLEYQWQRVTQHSRELKSLSWSSRRRYVAGRLRNRKALREAEDTAAADPVKVLRAKVERATIAAARRYVPGYFPGPVNLLLPSLEWTRSAAKPLRWRSVAPDVREYCVLHGCNSDVMLREPHAPLFAELLSRSCRLPATNAFEPKTEPLPFPTANVA